MPGALPPCLPAAGIRRGVPPFLNCDFYDRMIGMIAIRPGMNPRGYERRPMNRAGISHPPRGVLEGLLTVLFFARYTFDIPRG
jgi:hypothetical protein